MKRKKNLSNSIPQHVKDGYAAMYAAKPTFGQAEAEVEFQYQFTSPGAFHSWKNSMKEKHQTPDLMNGAVPVKRKYNSKPKTPYMVQLISVPSDNSELASGESAFKLAFAKLNETGHYNFKVFQTINPNSIVVMEEVAV